MFEKVVYEKLMELDSELASIYKMSAELYDDIGMVKFLSSYCQNDNCIKRLNEIFGIVTEKQIQR